MNPRYYISADNTKNACCTDIKGATTVDCSLVVKIGDSCLFDEEKEIKIIYYFNKSKE